MNELIIDSDTQAIEISRLQEPDINCRIIGVLDDGVNSLSNSSLNYLKQADVIIAATRTLKLFSPVFSGNADLFDLTGNIAKISEWIISAQQQHKQIVVLATGDPLCHGIAKIIINKINFQHCEILPNVSTIQLAFSRLGLAWQNIKICSIHNKDTGEWKIHSDASHGLYHLLQLLKTHDTIAIFTSPDNSPDRIARMLTLEGYQDDFSLFAVENILLNNEKIVGPLDISRATQYSFADPNIVILQRKNNKPITNDVMFGNPDKLFKQRKPDKGLITKCEVRAVSLARMQLIATSIIWDIGAGSGAVGIEAARLSPQGHVYAIEKNQADYDIANQNKTDFKITNYSLFHAKAPQQMISWPAPNAIFIGGSGGELTTLIKLCLSRMLPSAHLVMNFVTIENLTTAIECLKNANNIEWDITQISASRSKPILNMYRFQAENPVWIITAAQKMVENNE